jgi:hypothetical protein
VKCDCGGDLRVAQGWNTKGSGRVRKRVCTGCGTRVYTDEKPRVSDELADAFKRAPDASAPYKGQRIVVDMGEARTR